MADNYTLILPLPYSEDVAKPMVYREIHNLSPADYNCTYGIRWIWAIMGQCVMDTRGLVAVVLGFICLFLWITTGIPQIVENFRTGLAHKAISPLFLLCWLIGDISNLIGCILTHQLILQLVIAIYSIANDLVLCGQFIYSKLRHDVFLQRINESLGDRRISSTTNLLDNSVESDIPIATSPLLSSSKLAHNSSSQRLAVCLLGVINMGLLTTLCQIFEEPVHNSNVHFDFQSQGSFSTRHLLQLQSITPTNASHVNFNFLDEPEAKLGYLFGWISSSMYLCSRLPQLYINWRRKSTKGLCVHMFCMTIVGNASYGLQIFVACTERLYLLRAIPWIVGSWGVLALDMMMLGQFYSYRVKTPIQNDLQCLVDACDSVEV